MQKPPLSFSLSGQGGRCQSKLTRSLTHSFHALFTLYVRICTHSWSLFLSVWWKIIDPSSLVRVRTKTEWLPHTQSDRCLRCDPSFAVATPATVSAPADRPTVHRWKRRERASERDPRVSTVTRQVWSSLPTLSECVKLILGF